MRAEFGRRPARNELAVVVVLAWRTWVSAHAAVINVGPGDSYTKIEAAKAGDEVVIAPGTYAFRVYLTARAPATNPITIRAADRANPPVWDFGTNLVENAPGSYGAGDKGRGGWQFSGAANYQVSGIVFRNCRTASLNSAGIRYYNGTTNLYLKDCVFRQNDNGLTGGTQESEVTVEFCEFDANGNPGAGSPTHNIYIYGGSFTMRYSYLHDSVQAQNFHIRARNSVLEFNWFARAKSYEGDLMTDDDFSGTGPFSQTITLRGNVLVQHSSPDNHSQVVAVFNDAQRTNLTLSVRAMYNTFVGNGGNAAFVHLSNSDATRMTLELSDNIISGTTRPVLVESNPSATVTGVNNWLQNNAVVGSLVNSIQSPSPGFRNPAAKDYTLTTNSVCLGAANTTVFGLPGREYFRNEATNRFWRPRVSARDVGAFEGATTNNPVGPYDPLPPPGLAATREGANLNVAWPLYAAEFRLETSTALPSGVWTTAGFPYSTSAFEVHVSIPTTAGQAYFRLTK